jgi:hypothetical protein
VAFYIVIDKVAETETEARYNFYDTAYPGEVGELRLDKSTGEIEMTKATREAFFTRAAAKIARHYRQGDLPGSTEWAS